MPIATVPVTCNFTRPDGQSLNGAYAVIRLSAVEVVPPYVVVNSVVKVPLVAGSLPAGFTLVENAGALSNTIYAFSIEEDVGAQPFDQVAAPSQFFLGYAVILGPGPVALYDVLVPAFTEPMGVDALALAQAAAVAATTQAGIATTQAGIATGAAADAQASAIEASLYGGFRQPNIAAAKLVAAGMIPVGENLWIEDIDALWQRAPDAATDADQDFTATGGVKWYLVPTARPSGNSRPAFIEQFITGFFGRGMLAAEVDNKVTEQSVTGSAGANTVTTSANADYIVGGQVMIRHDNGMYLPYTAQAISGGSFTLVPALEYACTVSGRMERLWFNRAHPGKFYMRYLAQRIAGATETNAAMPRRRSGFSAGIIAPTRAEDKVTPFGTATINYYAPTAASPAAGSPPRFNWGRGSVYANAFGANGHGVDTAFWSVSGGSDYLAKVILLSGVSNSAFALAVIDENGKTLGLLNIPAGSIFGRAVEVTVPFTVAGSQRVKLRVTVTSNFSSASIAIDKVDIFDAPDAVGKLIPDGSVVVCLGDSWFAGDLGNTPEREPVPMQLSKELPGCRIVNSGFGGNTITQMLARFDADVAPHNPSHVVLISGTNDCYNPASSVWNPNSLDSFVSVWAEIKRKCSLIGARLITVGPPALAEDRSGVPDAMGASANNAPFTYTDWALNNRARELNLWMIEKATSPVQMAGVENGLVVKRPYIVETASTTPTVTDISVIELNYSTAKTVTNLLGAVTDQVVEIRAANGNVTLQHGIFKLPNLANLTMTEKGVVRLRRGDTSASTEWLFEYDSGVSSGVRVETPDLVETSSGTPSVVGVRVLELNYATPTDVTNLLGGVSNQVVVVRSKNGNATLKSSIFKLLPGGTDLVLPANGEVTVRREVVGIGSSWYRKGGGDA